MEYNMIFAMGYDLLQNKLAEQDLSCDIAFYVCKEIYDNFLVSEEYKLDMSEYEALRIYIIHNEWTIDNLIKENGGW